MLCGQSFSDDRLTLALAVHNSFARSDPFHLEEHRPQDESEDAYHFIAYLPIGDKLCVSGPCSFSERLASYLSPLAQIISECR